MKKFLIVLAGFAAGALVLVSPGSALAAQAKTNITGVITNNGHVVENAKVTAVCNGHGKSDKTDAAGSYLITFKGVDCPEGSKVTVVATKKGLGGTSTKTVASITTKLNVAIVNVDVPEFGIVTGFASAALAGGAFLMVRRRQQVQN